MEAVPGGRQCGRHGDLGSSGCAEDAELCLVAAQKCGLWTLEEVPEALRTAEVCQLTLVADGGRWSAEYRDLVPPAVRRELCPEEDSDDLDHECCRGPGGGPRVWPLPVLGARYVQDGGFCAKAVRDDGWALKGVTEALKPPKFCLETVWRAGKALDRFRDAEKRGTVQCGRMGGSESLHLGVAGDGGPERRRNSARRHGGRTGVGRLARRDNRRKDLAKDARKHGVDHILLRNRRQKVAEG